MEVTNPEFFSSYLPDILLTETELASTILGSLTTALLTMTTITFSTIMVVLTTYSSQFSPRTLQNFIHDKITIKVLAIFIASFVYAVTSLAFMQEENVEGLLLSGTFGVFLSIICVGFFVYFIHHVAASIHVQQLIKGISTQATAIIEQVNQSDGVSLNKETLIQRKAHYSHQVHVSPPRSGYVQHVDFSKLKSTLKEKDALIEFDKQIGDFVTEFDCFYTLYSKEEINESIKEVIQEALTIGDERTTLQDLEFSIQQLVEITLRAISSGINDPHTAIACINELGRTIGHIAKANTQNNHHLDDDQILRVIIHYPRDFEDTLYTAFYQIRIHGKNDISVIGACLDALTTIALATEEDEHHETLIEFAYYLLSATDFESLHHFDQRYLTDKVNALKEHCE